MPVYLRYATASQEVVLGYFLDSTDGNTEETALTIANTDIRLHKTGATTLANKNSGGATHISNGLYYAVLDATDTDTLGSMIIYCHPTGALSTKVETVVLPAQVYDSIILGTDLLDVNTSQVGGTTQTARDLGASVLLSSGTGTGQISLTSGAVTVGTNNDKAGYALSAAGVDAIWDEPIAGHLTAGTAGLSEALGSAALIDSTITGTSTSTSFTFTGGATSNNFYNDQLIYILSGTGIGQVRPVLSSTYSAGTTTITVDEAFIVTPAAADRFAILVTHVHALTQITDHVDSAFTEIKGATWSASTDTLEHIRDKQTDIETDTQDLQTQIGTAGAGLTNINLPDQTMNITGNITGNLSGSVGSVTGAVGSVTGAVGSVTGNVGGNVTGSVGSVTATVTADIESINGVTITGNGSTTPFDV